MTLTEFLLARIAEDKQALPPLFDGVEWIGGRMVDMNSRALAECAARRSIVEAAARAARADHRAMGPLSDLADVVLTQLATTYADHPDYRQEWKP